MGTTSWLQSFEQTIWSSPIAATAFRQFYSLWLALPDGPFRVRRTDNLHLAMADGVNLAMDHIAPQTELKLPAILIRTPYGKDGAANLAAGLFSHKFASFGYHVIVQDVRGRFQSEGDWVAFLHEASDGRATLDWIAAQAWFDGNAAMWGASYLGYCQWAAASTKSPNLKALAPQVTSANLMKYPEHGFPLDLLLRWMFQTQTMDDATLGMREKMQRITDGAVQDRFLGPAFMHLPINTADEVAIGKAALLYREMADADPTHPHWSNYDYSGIVAEAPAGTFISGWYDLFLDGLLTDFAAQQAAGLNPYLTIGPWHHLDMGHNAAAFTEGLAWFNAKLKGDAGKLRARPVRIYVMGLDQWRTFDRWPPPSRATPLYLSGSGVAKTGRLRWDKALTGDTVDHYRYDPAFPTPNLGGPKMGNDAGQVDNRALAARPDVLVFSTPPLTDPVDVVGSVTAELFVKSDRQHADFVVRLCEIDRKGVIRNICDGNFRVQPGRGELQPDGSLRIRVAMSSTAYRFRADHRICVLVSSGAHPRFARNLGVPEPQVAAVDLQPAVQTLYHDALHPSALVLPLVSLG
ncbi:MAG: CocE/NonD family hydrolase [Anaerolineales bacterium]|nr:CocE/NonD family hydrolase [Anaerolineales bacterium]